MFMAAYGSAILQTLSVSPRVSPSTPWVSSLFLLKDILALAPQYWFIANVKVFSESSLNSIMEVARPGIKPEHPAPNTMNLLSR